MEANIFSLVERLRDEHRFIEAAIVRYLKLLHEKRAASLGGSIAVALENLQDYWERHVQFEEEEVFPLLEGHDLVEELRMEHRRTNELLSLLKGEKDPKRRGHLLEELLLLKQKHLAKENRHLIPLLEEMAASLA